VARFDKWRRTLANGFFTNTALTSCLIKTTNEFLYYLFSSFTTNSVFGCVMIAAGWAETLYDSRSCVSAAQTAAAREPEPLRRAVSLFLEKTNRFPSLMKIFGL
jgi:hypothetical protein